LLPPNHPIKCAYIFPLKPGYIIVFEETLLTLVAPTLPFAIPVKLEAVLVLLLVSAVSVVVGFTGVVAHP
jgi:hypothetical protein